MPCPSAVVVQARDIPRPLGSKSCHRLNFGSLRFRVDWKEVVYALELAKFRLLSWHRGTAAVIINLERRAAGEIGTVRVSPPTEFRLTLALCLFALSCSCLALSSRCSRRCSPSLRIARSRKRSSCVFSFSAAEKWRQGHAVKLTGQSICSV